MFDIGWTELLLVAVVAIVVIGPKDLPKAMRVVGQWTAKMKRMAREFQGQINEAIRETELDSVQRDIKAIGKIDPLKDVTDEVQKTRAEIRKGMSGVALASEAPAATKGPGMGEAKPPVPEAPAAKAPAPAGGDAKP